VAARFPLSVIIQAVDRVTAPLRRVNDRIRRLTAPVNRLTNSFRALSEAADLPRLMSGFVGVGRAIGGVGRELGALVRRIGVFIGLSGAGFLAIVRGAMQAGDELRKASARVGMTANAYAQLQFVAERTGIAQQEFTTSMEFFVKTLGQAKAGTGSLVTLLKAVSPHLLQQMTTARSTEEALNLMFRAIGRLDDPSKRAALAIAAFGRSGAKMAEVARLGADEIAALRAEFVRLQGDQEEFARLSEEADDAWTNLTHAMRGARNAAVVEIFPILTDLLRRLTDFIVENRKAIADWARNFAKGLPAKIDALIDGFRRFYAMVEPVAHLLGGWPQLIAAIGAAIIGGPLLLSLATLTASIVSLGAAIGFTPIGWFLGALALLAAAAVMVVKHWAPIKQFFADLWGGIKKVFQGFLDYVVGIFTLDLQRAWEGIKKIFDGIKNVVKQMLKISPVGMIARAFRGREDELNLDEGAAMPPMLGAAAARPQPTLAAANSEAHVTVDFRNLPRGARVSTDPRSTALLDLSMGYSMLEAF